MAKALLTVACCPSAAALLPVLLGSFLHGWVQNLNEVPVFGCQIWKVNASGIECDRFRLEHRRALPLCKLDGKVTPEYFHPGTEQLLQAFVHLYSG